MTNNEWLTSNIYISYPFKENASGLNRLDTNDKSKLPVDLFVDAVIRTDLTSLIYLLKASVVNNTIKFTIGDDNNHTLDLVLNNVLDKRFNILSGDNEFFKAKLLVNSEAVNKYKNDIISLGGKIDYGFSLPFEDRVICIENLKVKSLNVIYMTPLGPDIVGPINGDIFLNSGHNIDLEVENNSIIISAHPGSGKGRVNIENNIPPVMSMKGITAVNNNINIVGGEDGCYGIVFHPTTGIIQIVSRCAPCCSCQDYVDMLGTLSKIANNVRSVKNALDSGRNIYENGVAYYNEHIFPKYSDLILTARAARGSDWDVGATERGAPNWLKINIELKNRSNVSQYNIEKWNVTFTDPTPIDYFYTFEDVTWEYDGQTGKTEISGPLPIIDPGKILTIIILVKVELEIWHQNPKWDLSVYFEARDLQSNLLLIRSKRLVVQ